MTAGDVTPGTRRPNGTAPDELEPGEYTMRRDHLWVRLPNGACSNLDGWDITEHDDGTVTASPSILSQAPGFPEHDWHGYLEQGNWREV